MNEKMRKKLLFTSDSRPMYVVRTNLGVSKITYNYELAYATAEAITQIKSIKFSIIEIYISDPVSDDDCMYVGDVVVYSDEMNEDEDD